MLLVCQIRLDVNVVVVVVVVEECGVCSAQASGLNDALVRSRKGEMCGLLSSGSFPENPTCTFVVFFLFVTTIGKKTASACI